jgi:FdhE protein
MEQLKEKIDLYKKMNSSSVDMLEFYEKILEAKESFKNKITASPAKISKRLISFHAKEGFPLLAKEDFVIDIPLSVELFGTISRIGKKTNEKMKKNIQAIEEAIAINALNIRDLLKNFSDDAYLNKIVGEFDIDLKVLKFFVFESVRPFIKANRESLKSHLDLKNWLKGYCPVCGSLPSMSFLKGEGQRYFQCSLCELQWPGVRLQCPFCGSSYHKDLHYFYAEGDEAHRVDLCDKCNRYIKTLDSRKIDYDPDLDLEDIVTLHLDLLASQRGFKRALPSLWM